VINHASQAIAAAQGLRFPVLIKANVGGSGAGITASTTPAALAAAASLDLGVDHTALVQEYAPLRGERIVRVEVLGAPLPLRDRGVPAGRVSSTCARPTPVRPRRPRSSSRSACALDAPRNGMRSRPSPRRRGSSRPARRSRRRPSSTSAGIEYLIDDRDGEAYFYDINALSNFVADGVNVVGFDPFERLVDYLAARAARGA
jgi:hypothetical protein